MNEQIQLPLADGSMNGCHYHLDVALQNLSSCDFPRVHPRASDRPVLDDAAQDLAPPLTLEDFDYFEFAADGLSGSQLNLDAAQQTPRQDEGSQTGAPWSYGNAFMTGEDEWYSELGIGSSLDSMLRPQVRNLLDCPQCPPLDDDRSHVEEGESSFPHKLAPTHQNLSRLLQVSHNWAHKTDRLRGALFTDDDRWEATLVRSRAGDHQFVYGVLTTRIYCLPSCASRRPSRRNVRFFSFPGAIEAAKQSGFRACRRCKPDSLDPADSSVYGVCNALRMIIDSTFSSPSGQQSSIQLEELAKTASLSTFHFHRLFKATTQVTPADFISACNSLALQDSLGQDTDGSHKVSYNAMRKGSYKQWSSRSAKKALGGVSEAEYVKGALHEPIRYSCVECPAGKLCVAFSDKGVPPALLLGPNADTQMRIRFPTARNLATEEISLQQCIEALEEQARDRDTKLPRDILPTLWRARVWLQLKHDPVCSRPAK